MTRAIRFLLYLVLIAAAFIIGSLFVSLVFHFFGDVGGFIAFIAVVVFFAWRWSKPAPKQPEKRF